MTIGERIKAKRIELNLSQEELAKMCGYKSRSSINKIELARDLPLRKIEVMARALDVTPAYLMGWEEPEDFLQRFGNSEPAEESDETKQLLEDFAALTHDQQLTVLALIHSMNPNGEKDEK